MRQVFDRTSRKLYTKQNRLYRIFKNGTGFSRYIWRAVNDQSEQSWGSLVKNWSQVRYALKGHAGLYAMFKALSLGRSRLKLSKASAPEFRLCALAIAAILAGGALVEQQLGSRVSTADSWTPDPSVEVDPSPEIYFAPVTDINDKPQDDPLQTSSKGQTYTSKEQCEADAAAQDASPDAWETLCWGLPSTD